MLPMWNLQLALNTLRTTAFASWRTHTGEWLCATATRRAIVMGFGGDAAEAQISRNDAENFDNTLRNAQFVPLGMLPGDLLPGDVIHIQPFTSEPHGHVAMWDGTEWISDYRQGGGPAGFYPNGRYRRVRPPYQIWRYYRAGIRI
jgi:hypothetical protein